MCRQIRVTRIAVKRLTFYSTEGAFTLFGFIYAPKLVVFALITFCASVEINLTRVIRFTETRHRL